MSPTNQKQRLNLDLVQAVEEFRLAEAQLARRHQAACGPSETERAAMRHILELTDLGETITPTALAKHLDVSTASTTNLLDRLTANGLITREPSPVDRRSSIIRPTPRTTDPDQIDPLDALIRELAAGLPPDDAEVVNRFLGEITQLIAAHCR